MKDKLRIGEFAKLKNVTTETLRHYDRVGLLEPIEIDEDTGYRYYSVFQSSKLASIIELKALGFSIDEMKDFFNNRKLTQTYSLLENKHDDLKMKIKQLKRLEKSMSKKLSHLSDMITLDSGTEYIIRREKEQKIAFIEQTVDSWISFEWMASDLENKLVNIYPAIGTDAYGMMLSQEAFLKRDLFGHTHMIYFLEDTKGVDVDLIRTLPARTIACFIYRGKLENIRDRVDYMRQKLKEDAYEIIDDVTIKFRITSTDTDDTAERIYEFQIPIK